MSSVNNLEPSEFLMAPDCEPCALPMVAKNRYQWQYLVILAIGIAFDFYGIFAMFFHFLGFYLGGFLLVAGMASLFFHAILRNAMWVCRECGTVQKCEDEEVLVVDPDEPHRFRRENPEQFRKTRLRSSFWGTFLVLAQIAALLILSYYLFPSYYLN